MLKLFLSLYSWNFNEKPSISLTSNRPSDIGKEQLFRSSPIYQVNSKYAFDKLTDEFSGEIIFIFTVQPLKILDSISQEDCFSQTGFKIYFSQGFASLILFFPDASIDCQNYLEHLDDIAGIETWEIKKNEVLSTKNNFPDLKFSPHITLDLENLGHEEQVIFSDIISSLNLAYTFSYNLLNVYVAVLDEVKRKILDFYYRTLFLDNKIDFTLFEKKCKEININNQEYVEDLIEYYKTIVEDLPSIEQVYIKDEIIQISSVLKNSNAQLFGCIPVFHHSMFQSGKNSLLGISNNVLGFLSIYLHLRKCFNKFGFDCVFEEKYSKFRSPKFLLKPDPVSYAQWYREFIDVNGLDDYLEEKIKNSTHLIVYFSNRQGFRLTKHAVSAAMQSLYLSFLPSFTLNTVTHELLHAHVRSEIMVEFYPLVENNKEFSFRPDLIEKYKNIFTSDQESYSIKDFIQINFLFMAGIFIDKGSDYKKCKVDRHYPEEDLNKSLKNWYKEIEEIIVHILDLHYFYSSKGDFYTRAIWISWLSLPFSIHNLQYYILRTICAISSLDDSTDRLKRFDLAISLLKNELNEIKKLNSLNNDYIDIVLDCLKDESDKLKKVRFLYTNAFVNLVDISKKFFFSSKLKSALNYDIELTESTKENEYTYDLNIGEFENRNIGSPITLINEINNLNISNIEKLNALSKDEVERLSLWLNTLIITSLKNYNDG